MTPAAATHWILLAKREAVDLVREVQYFIREWCHVMDMHAARLIRVACCEMEITRYLVHLQLRQNTKLGQFSRLHAQLVSQGDSVYMIPSTVDHAYINCRSCHSQRGDPTHGSLLLLDP